MSFAWSLFPDPALASRSLTAARESDWRGGRLTLLAHQGVNEVLERGRCSRMSGASAKPGFRLSIPAFPDVGAHRMPASSLRRAPSMSTYPWPGLRDEAPKPARLRARAQGECRGESESRRRKWDTWQGRWKVTRASGAGGTSCRICERWRMRADSGVSRGDLQCLKMMELAPVPPASTHALHSNSVPTKRGGR
jgi:hypothetical protein